MQPQNSMNVQIVQLKPQQNKKTANYLVMIGLVLSFIFIGIFNTFNVSNGKAMVQMGETPASSFWSYCLFLSLASWIIFELLLRAYYFFVSMSMYVFVVPKKQAYLTFRATYALRNLVLGGICYFLFLSPIFINYISFFTIICDFAALCGAFWWIKKQYLGSLLAPFAWKAFMRPFIAYEVIMLVLSLGGIL